MFILVVDYLVVVLSLLPSVVWQSVFIYTLKYCVYLLCCTVFVGYDRKSFRLVERKPIQFLHLYAYILFVGTFEHFQWIRNEHKSLRFV